MPTCHFYEQNFKVPPTHYDTYTIMTSIWKRFRDWADVGMKRLVISNDCLRYSPFYTRTRHDIRLNENNIPKSGEEPINAIDQLAYIHDLAYRNSNHIGDRHRADQEMINGLKQLKNLSIPQRLIRQLIIRLFQAKIKLRQGIRAAKHKQQKVCTKSIMKQNGQVIRKQPTKI